jgi:hypothetical protein
VTASFSNVTQLYETIATGTIGGNTLCITTSFVNPPNKQTNITLAQAYSFTCSNLPAANYVSDILLYITNTTVSTSSLSFPAGWVNLGGGWPTALSASRAAMLWLRATGEGTVMGSFNAQL